MAVVVTTAMVSAARSAAERDPLLPGVFASAEEDGYAKTAAMRRTRALAALRSMVLCPLGVAMCCKMSYAAIQFDAVDI
jgi:hypothetical protein